MRAWKREFLEKMHLAFEKDRDTIVLQRELEKAYRKIGQLEPERRLTLKLCIDSKSSASSYLMVKICKSS